MQSQFPTRWSCFLPCRVISYQVEPILYHVEHFCTMQVIYVPCRSSWLYFCTMQSDSLPGRVDLQHVDALQIYFTTRQHLQSYFPYHVAWFRTMQLCVWDSCTMYVVSYRVTQSVPRRMIMYHPGALDSIYPVHFHLSSTRIDLPSTESRYLVENQFTWYRTTYPVQNCVAQYISMPRTNLYHVEPLYALVECFCHRQLVF